MKRSVSARERSDDAPNTLVGWQGLRFVLPPEWNVTAVPMSAGSGYLKIDSPGTMFAQIRWLDPGAGRPNTLLGMLMPWIRSALRRPEAPRKNMDLQAQLERFLKPKGRAGKRLEHKVRPEETDADRRSVRFSWSGKGQAQGKIWECRSCGRVVMAQVVGESRDPVADTAALMFANFCDHGVDGWNTWALYDLVAAAPEEYRLVSQKLMSGYLKLSFRGASGEHLVIERWGLANVTRKKFTLSEWFATQCTLAPARCAVEEGSVMGHAAVLAAGKQTGPLAMLKGLRDAIGSWRPANRYDAAVWECEESNKTYAVQITRSSKSESLLQQVLARCECH